MTEQDTLAMSAEIVRLRNELASIGNQNITLAGQLEAAIEEIAMLNAYIAAANKGKELPPGWRYEDVPSAEFDDLMFWLDRCDDKGHLDNCPDLIVPMAAFNRARYNRAMLESGKAS